MQQERVPDPVFSTIFFTFGFRHRFFAPVLLFLIIRNMFLAFCAFSTWMDL